MVLPESGMKAHKTPKEKKEMSKREVLIKEVPMQALDREESPVRCL